MMAYAAVKTTSLTTSLDSTIASNDGDAKPIRVRNSERSTRPTC